MNDVLKEKVVGNIEGLKEELIGISQYIFQHPELGFKEFEAAKALTDKLSEHGFAIQKGVCELETAFIATYGQGQPVIAFMAEYDALPEMGHACGHNIIATAAIGAAIGVSKVISSLGGTVKVIGTPAEEGGCGKVIMLERGAFDDIDVAMLVHPTHASMADDISFASRVVEYTFRGKPAHAAAYPWVGVNALSGVIELFNMTNAMRLHVKDYARIHGIITEGGVAPNIIPEIAKCVFSLRSLNSEYLEEVIQMVNRCAQGAALATGTSLEQHFVGLGYKEIRNNKVLVRLMQDNFDILGEPTVQRTLNQGIGSTDVGNVTHKIPAIQSYIGLGSGIATHTQDFAERAGSEVGDKAAVAAAKVMAMTAVDILQQPAVLAEIKAYYDATAVS